MWRNDDSPPLPDADPQQGLVHALDHIPHPDVRVVSAVPLITGINALYHKLHIFLGVSVETEEFKPTWRLLNNVLPDPSSPGVKGDAVQERSVVMVPNVVAHHGPACARLGNHLVLDGDVIFGVVNVLQQDVEHQRGLWGDLRPCRTGSGGRHTFKFIHRRRRGVAATTETASLASLLRTRSLLSVRFERRDGDVPDLSHAHAQQALIHAFDQPTFAHQRVVGLLPGVAGLIQVQSQTHNFTQTYLDDTVQTHTQGL